MIDVGLYRVIYYYSQEDEAYLALIPDLPGCISDGQTINEAVRNVRSLAVDWLTVMESHGEEIQRPSFADFPEGPPIRIFDAAGYILETLGTITTKHLQKLLYYCKAWSCGWFGRALFPEPFEAWAGGPINRKLFNAHSGKRMIARDHIKSAKALSADQKKFINQVIGAYEDMDPDALGDATHREAPWIIARGGLPDGEHGHGVISDEDMISYYGQAV